MTPNGVTLQTGKESRARRPAPMTGPVADPAPTHHHRHRHRHRVGDRDRLGARCTFPDGSHLNFNDSRDVGIIGVDGSPTGGERRRRPPTGARSRCQIWPRIHQQKILKLERIISIRETNGNFDSRNSCTRLGTRCSHELHESKFHMFHVSNLSVQTFEFVCSCIRGRCLYG